MRYYDLKHYKHNEIIKRNGITNQRDQLKKMRVAFRLLISNVKLQVNGE